MLWGGKGDIWRMQHPYTSKIGPQSEDLAPSEVLRRVELGPVATPPSHASKDTGSSRVVTSPDVVTLPRAAVSAKTSPFRTSGAV